MSTARAVAALTATLVFVLGCGTSSAPSTPPTIAPPSSSPTGGPSPTGTFRHGVQGLVDDLKDRGVAAAVADSFDGQPLATEQILVCANGEEIRVFSYGTQEERLAVSSRIDPADPSNVGTSIVEWDGWPKLWGRDRIIVIYLGHDEATIGVLTELMGEPFAQGANNPQRLPAGC